MDREGGSKLNFTFHDSALTMLVMYTNYRGETALRRIRPRRLYFGSTPHHKDEQWLLDVWDYDKGADRTYALKDCDFTYKEKLKCQS